MVHLNSMPMTVFTLWMCVTEGPVGERWRMCSWRWNVFMIAYVCLMLLAMLNIVTGIFVHDSIETAQMNLELSCQLEQFQVQELDIHEFVMGCLSLCGGAKAVDMAAVMRENKGVLKRIQRMTKVTLERLNRLDVLLSPIFLQQEVMLR